MKKYCIKRIKIFFPLIIFFLNCFAQKETDIVHLRNGTYKKFSSKQLSQKINFTEARGFSLCECLRQEYKNSFIREAADSCFNKNFNDYSGSYFVQLSPLSISSQNKLTAFIEKNLKKFRAIPMEKSPLNPSANMAGYTCWKFYESGYLRNYINILLKIK